MVFRKSNWKNPSHEKKCLNTVSYTLNKDTPFHKYTFFPEIKTNQRLFKFTYLVFTNYLFLK